MLPLNADGSDALGADGARILTFGGSLSRSVASTSATEITTLGAEITHEVAQPLAHPRWHANGVLLPDGSVLATGGGMWDNVYVHGQRSAPVMTAERFDPATSTWSAMADATVPRTYHSTAVLLPDGRVITGGHVPLPVPWKDARDNVPYESQIVETRLEIYEPPYLHWGARPHLADAPDAISYGTTFDVRVDQASTAPDVVDAVLVRAGATTHAWDNSQRLIELDVVDSDGGNYTFTAPSDGDVAAPGTYLLFVRGVDSQGRGLIPSVAEIVMLG